MIKSIICFLLASILQIVPVQTLFAQTGWLQQNSGTTVNLNSTNFDHSTSNRVWVCGDSGTILYTSNAGTNWIRQSTGTVNNLYGIAYHEDNGTVIAVGAGGIVLRTTNQGTNWINIPTPTSSKLNDISDWRFYAVGDGGTIIHSTDGGLTWFNRVSNTANDLNSVIGLEPVPIAVGDNGTIVKSNSTGVNWVVVTSGTSMNLYGVPLFPINFAAGAGGTLLRSTNTGSNWFPVATGVTYDLNFIGDASGTIYIAGNGGKILKSTDNGSSWFTQNTPTVNNLKCVYFYLFVNTSYAVGNNGTILATTTGGVTAIEPVNTHVPDIFSLHQNYPNPFNPETTIRFDIPENNAGAVTSLRIYNVQGIMTDELLNEELRAGSYEVKWNAAPMPSGIYYLRLTSGSYIATKKMVLIK